MSFGERFWCFINYEASSQTWKAQLTCHLHPSFASTLRLLFKCWDTQGIYSFRCSMEKFTLFQMSFIFNCHLAGWCELRKSQGEMLRKMSASLCIWVHKESRVLILSPWVQLYLPKWYQGYSSVASECFPGHCEKCVFIGPQVSGRPWNTYTVFLTSLVALRNEELVFLRKNIIYYKIIKIIFKADGVWALRVYFLPSEIQFLNLNVLFIAFYYSHSPKEYQLHFLICCICCLMQELKMQTQSMMCFQHPSVLLWCLYWWQKNLIIIKTLIF